MIERITNLDTPQLWNLFGWTMLHYLWIGAALGLLLAGVRLVLRGAPANVRYLYAIASLLVLTVCPLGITVYIVQTTDFEPASADIAMNASALGASALGLPSEIDGTFPIDLEPSSENRLAPSGSLSETIELSDSVPPFVAQEPPASPEAEEYAASLQPMAETDTEGALSAETEIAAPTPWSKSQQAIDSLATYLPWLWISGAPLTFLLLATGLVGAERLKRHSQPLAAGEGAGFEIVSACQKLATELGIRRQVAVGVCQRLTGPILVGVMKPMILLPPAALSGWTPEQVEMVLLHELAHVRRWDNLINLLQRVVESVLFFQPAIWIVSGWARSEREQCCDALVVTHTDRPREYAQTLAHLAGARFHTPETAAVSLARAAGPISSMAQKHLITRIRHILNKEREPMQVTRKTLLAMVVLLVGVMFAATWVGPRAGADETDSKETEAIDLASAEGEDLHALKEGSTPEPDMAELDNNTEAPESSDAVVKSTAIKPTASKSRYTARELAALDIDIRILELHLEQQAFIIDETQESVLQGNLPGDIIAPYQLGQETLKKELEIMKARRQMVGHELEFGSGFIATAFAHPERRKSIAGRPLTEEESQYLSKLIQQLKDLRKNYDEANEKFSESVSAKQINLVDSMIEMFELILKRKQLMSSEEPVELKEDTALKEFLHASGIKLANSTEQNESHLLSSEFTFQEAKSRHKLAKERHVRMQRLANENKISKIKLIESRARFLRSENDLQNAELGAEYLALQIELEQSKAEDAQQKYSRALRANEENGSMIYSQSLLNEMKHNLKLAESKVAIRKSLLKEKVGEDYFAELEATGRFHSRPTLPPATPAVAHHQTEALWGVKKPRTTAALTPAKRPRPTVPSNSNQQLTFDQRNDLEMAKLDAEEAKIKLDAARRDWERKKSLRKKGYAQEREVSLAETEFLLSQIAAQKAELALKRIEEQVKRQNAAPAAPSWGLPGQPIPTRKGQPNSPQRVLPVTSLPATHGVTRAPSRAQPVGLPTKSKSSKKPTLLYDGKTFDQWNQEWRTELNPNKRAIAIKAFRQFAKAGYAKEAAKAILEVMQNYDSLIRENSAEAQLSGTAALGYAAIVDQEVSMRLLVDELESERRNGQHFALLVLSVPRSNELTRTKTYEEALSAIARLIENQKVDRRTRIAAMDCAVNQDRTYEPIQAALLKTMKDKDRRVALEAIAHLVPDSNTWSSILDSKKQGQQGQQGQSWGEYITELPDGVVDEVVALMKSEEADARVRAAAWHAFVYLEMHPRLAHHVQQSVEKLKRGNLKRNERLAAYYILSQAKPEAIDQIVPLLIEQYQWLAGYAPSEDNAIEKASILNALHEFGPKSRAALPLIKEAAKSKYGALQRSAQKALISIGPEDTSNHAE